ncbi:MAG: RyR domain-containing protein [Lamprobacter sp.]|uniref:RyR domain-containing protein n=1 Tax=Lamprobacter sp. TaxID=3100796 RepID=UPI002B25B8C0|nr:RyR domain-containing protein [Lamprobacter sp.]MEA3641071.1 RyR domain-containing protein [Lamprobacter sp.]
MSRSWMLPAWPRASARRLLLFGRGEVADACARVLRGGSDRLVRAQGADELSQRELLDADVLLLGGLDDPLALLAELSPRLGRGLRSRRRRQPLRLLIIDDGAAPAANDLAEARALWSDEVQFEQISIPTAAARRLLASWPLHWGADPRFGQSIHLAILGRSRFADALLVHALRISGYGEQRSHFTLLSETPGAWEQAFTRAYPQAHEIAELCFSSLEGVNLAALPTVTTAVVCIIDPNAEPAALAGRLLDVQQCSPPIFVEIGEAAPHGDLSDWDGQLIPISYRQLALDRAVLLDGKGDELAQVIHDHYRDTTEAQGRDPSLEPAGQPWSTLASSYRDANRHQADHLWAKLAMTDCKAAPESQVESFAFAPIEVEQLAVVEHGRWAADRWLDGWSYAPTRDNLLKQHPQLIPYQQLSGPMKDLDRFAVRLVPTLLARSGLGVLRMLVIGLSPMRSDLSPALPAARLVGLMRRVLTRLASRYPDRALVIAASLEAPVARQCVEMATDEFGAGYCLLLPRPLPSLLAGLEDAARLQVLALVARAERRISLSQAGDLERWLEQRAEILVELGAAERGGEGVPAVRKRVRVAPKAGIGLEWSFEY